MTACPQCGSQTTAVVAAAGVMPSTSPALALRCGQCGYEGVPPQAAPIKPPEGTVRIEIDTAELAKLDLRPGEVLILRVPDNWTAEAHAYIRHVVLDTLYASGYRNDVLALPRGVALAVLTPEDAA
ncbi:MAG: hypothetical protein V4472_25020 [Pseudomonadota bacterium]